MDNFFLHKDDQKFILILEFMVEISIDIIIKSYMNKKKILCGCYLDVMKNYKDEIIKKLKNYILDKNAEKNCYYLITFDDINKKFLKEKIVKNIFY